MYKYDWDPETGGIILLNYQSNMIPEVRPVFHEEMNVLGFDKYWKYEASEVPYMWNDGKSYYYRGKMLLEFKPVTNAMEEYEIFYIDDDSIGSVLEPVNMEAMISKNRDLIDSMAKDSMQSIYDIYEEFKNQVDIINVSYSGGKDSVVLLDLVKRILPANTYIVINSDTGMEFSFTEAIVKKEQEACEKAGIRFVKAKAGSDPKKMWEIIGPPSKNNRWCCSVQKSVPLKQTIDIITGKDNSRVLSFIGNRSSESRMRSGYDTVEKNMKFSFNNAGQPIISWNSAEVYLYIFEHNLELNEGYRKGLKRIGCAICPMASESGLKCTLNVAYDECKPWLDLIGKAYGDCSIKMRDAILEKGEWKIRNGGVGTVYESGFKDGITDGIYHIDFSKKDADWKMWMKTIGVLNEKDNTIDFRNKQYAFEIYEDENGCHVTVKDPEATADEEFIKLFRSVFIKAVFCVGCRACQMECPTGSMKMENGKVTISDKCLHCSKCHSNRHLCYSYRSKYIPGEVLD